MSSSSFFIFSPDAGETANVKAPSRVVGLGRLPAFELVRDFRGGVLGFTLRGLQLTIWLCESAGAFSAGCGMGGTGMCTKPVL